GMVRRRIQSSCRRYRLAVPRRRRSGSAMGAPSRCQAPPHRLSRGAERMVTIKRIVTHVKGRGMGYLPLHSSHFALPFKALLNEIAPVKDVGAWRAYNNDGKPTQISVTDPGHPIAKGVQGFTIPKTERYDEPFQVPGPETVVFSGTYGDGQHARQGLCWTIGKGRVFYFRPGHEENPIFFQPKVQNTVTSAVHWLAASATEE